MKKIKLRLQFEKQTGKKGAEFYLVALIKNFKRFASGQGYLVYSSVGFEIFDVGVFEEKYIDEDVTVLDLGNFEQGLAEQEIRNKPSTLFKTLKLALENGYSNIGTTLLKNELDNLVKELIINGYEPTYNNNNKSKQIRFFVDTKKIKINNVRCIEELRGYQFDLFLQTVFFDKDFRNYTYLATRLGNNPMVLTI